jgi:hypothetical protein
MTINDPRALAALGVKQGTTDSLPDGTCIPAGYREITLRAYTNGETIVIPEQPEWRMDHADNPYHNCDATGCGWEHIHVYLDALNPTGCGEL